MRQATKQPELDPAEYQAILQAGRPPQPDPLLPDTLEIPFLNDIISTPWKYTAALFTIEAE
ncbi:MAG: hypothetical protein JXA25_01485 [Anaerolineales bacterium]|nr:hypothetical protein [Anaerolineales bacterium]